MKHLTRQGSYKDALVLCKCMCEKKPNVLWQHHLIIVQAPAISYCPHAVHAVIDSQCTQYYDFYLTVTIVAPLVTVLSQIIITTTHLEAVDLGDTAEFCQSLMIGK